MITLKLFVWIIVFIGLELWRNYYIIVIKKRRPDYFNSAFIRIGGAFLFCPIILTVHNFLQWADIFIFQCTSFWILFTTILNRLRGLELFHLGEHSGWSDPWFLRHPTWFRIAVLVAFIFCILSVVLIYQR